MFDCSVSVIILWPFRDSEAVIHIKVVGPALVSIVEAGWSATPLSSRGRVRWGQEQSWGHQPRIDADRNVSPLQPSRTISNLSQFINKLWAPSTKWKIWVALCRLSNHQNPKHTDAFDVWTKVLSYILVTTKESSWGSFKLEFRLSCGLTACQRSSRMAPADGKPKQGELEWTFIEVMSLIHSLTLFSTVRFGIVNPDSKYI